MLRFVLAALALAAAATPAGADPVATIAAEHLSAGIVVRNAATAPGDSVDLALTHTLQPGWHTYWQNPGDSGEAPIAAWTLPDEATGAPLRFPTPERVPYPPLMNYGYSHDFTLLTGVTVPADWPAGTPYPVTLRMDWLVCADICIPEGGEATFAIPTGPATEADSAVAFTFLQAEWAMPRPSDVAATYRRDDDGRIVLDVPGVATADDAYFFALDRDATAHTADQTPSVGPDGLALTIEGGRGRLDGTLAGVLVAGGSASLVTATGPADPPDPAPTLAASAATPEPVAPLDPWRAVVLAFLGGLVLNLMPCVFPVLALKALGLVQHAGAPWPRRAAIGGAYTLGVLVAFGAVAATLFALKAAGGDVLWGFQLQSPGFVAAMAALLFLVGLNLSGVFAVGGGATRLGAHDRGEGVPGAFLSGGLAVLVATPCTAPFMAAALAAALVAPPLTAAAVFAALGLGLALPFALLSVVPGLARIMPRPGVWMERLRGVLAFPLYLTAAWLLWVLAQLVGVDALMPAFVAVVLLALAAWLYGLSQRGALRSHRVAAGFAAVSLGAAIAALWPIAEGRPVIAAQAATASDAYTPERLDALVASGRPVFVNVTAAWCITCEVNERVVLSTKSFADILDAHDAAYLEADWTRRDPDVTRLIERFGRAGVPLYLVYRPGDAPKVLPQLLSADVVAAALAP